MPVWTEYCIQTGLLLKVLGFVEHVYFLACWWWLWLGSKLYHSRFWMYFALTWNFRHMLCPMPGKCYFCHKVWFTFNY